jgi:DnaJ-class molecular chaperone
MKSDCPVCGGDGWLPSLPEGKSTCPACKGTGKV